MDGESSGNDLQSILAAIKSSEVAETRVQLVTKLGDIDLKEKSDIEALVESLIFWEDFTCLDISQCMLNKSILQVALKYLESFPSCCLPQYLSFGIKASVWCGKHLKMTLLSTEESQEEEHSSMFFQVLLDMLSFSAASISALVRCSESEGNIPMDIAERFILEMLNLTKDSIAENKKIPLESEVLKLSNMIIEAVIKLCRVYCESIHWDTIDEKSMEVDGQNKVDHVINMIKYTIKILCDIGVLAAKDGGNSVMILNVTWKSVITLLQLGKGMLAVNVNISDIVVTLLGLVFESLKCAAGAWSSPLNENVSLSEARRFFLPMKFYLINAVKISSLYPSNAYTAHKEMMRCVLMIVTFKIALSYQNFLKTASEVLTELLECISSDLITLLLNSDQVKMEQKFEILDYLFADSGDSDSCCRDSILIDFCLTSINGMFHATCESMNPARISLTGQVVLYLNLLRWSFELSEDAKLGVTRKLGWSLDILVDQDVYSSVLALELPLLYGSGKPELVWQPLFSSLLHSFKTFMIVVASSIAWGDFQHFLLENVFHPHFLCQEIIMELWCFMLRHAENGFANGIVDKLCSLFRLLTSPASVFPCYSLRKFTRPICMLLSCGPPSMAYRVYMSIAGDVQSKFSSSVLFALFMGGIPFNLLSDEIIRTVVQRISSDYIDFMECFLETPFIASDFGFPVFALSASLHFLQSGLYDIDVRTLKFLVSIIHYYKSAKDNLVKDHCVELMNAVLGIISNMKHLYASNEIEQVILELENLFISGPTAADAKLCNSKPGLALFMAGLCHMKMSESDDDAKSCAVWELYHMLLKERHWAFIHLALTAFGYFAARTDCNQLWRFVPQDAALSYDLVSGKEANQDKFMSEFKIFLEKEMAPLANIAPNPEQLEVLAGEGRILKEMMLKTSNAVEDAVGCQNMEVVGETQSHKKRKLPDGVIRGVELLQSGLKIIGAGLSQSTELQDDLITHFTCLEEVVSRFVGLTGS